MELVRDMGIGINLGNTFESCGDWIAQWGDGSVQSYETAWGSPMITQEIIQGYADAGFGVLRIPVAWSNLMGEDYTISGEYLAAVTEVVDWTLDTGMYAIINIHHDNGWMANFPTDTEECMYHYSRIWTQVSEAFQDYGDHLVFESMNEEGCWDSVWNQYSGSKVGKEDANWGKCRRTWGAEADFKELQKYMDMIKTNFIDQGIPVILGEYGCPKNNKEEESVRLFLTSVCKEAYERQICPILWDITDLHYDRSTCKMKDALLLEGLLENLVSNDSF